jgi:calcium-activated chloride channel regulator 4
MKASPLVAPIRRFLKTTVFAAGCLLAASFSRGGDGTIDTANKTIDLSVLFSYAESDANLDSAAVNWKGVFNDASKRLWNATNGQLHIGKVTVYRRAFNKKDSADVWILKGSGGAYANGVGKLGVAGNRMTFYQNTHRSMSAAYQGGFSIVHEMGHYVFGCYDEYLGASVPFAKKATFTNADLSAFTSNSPFVFSITDNSVIASIMDGGGAVNNLRTEFDTSGDVNKGQPEGTAKWWMHKQWIKNRESCWETMAKFKWGGINVFPAVPTTTSDQTVPAGGTDVTWDVVPTLSRLALCIDRSGSMSIANRMDLAIVGARILTSLTEEKHEFDLFPGTPDAEHVVFEGDILGVVDFDDQVTTTFPMTEVDAAGTTKASAKAAISGLFPDGLTAIGDGAQRSLNIITALGAKVTQEAIILLSDGEDNSSTVTPAAAAANAKARGAKIFAIALGAGADGSTLAAMAAATGGKFYAAANGLGLVDIYSRIYGELRGGGLVEALNDLSFEATATTRTVDVDPFTQEVTFSVASPETGVSFGLEITSPQGVKYTDSVPADGVVYASEGNEVHFRVSKPAPGKWKAKISSPDTDTGTTYQYSFLASSSNPQVSVSASPNAVSYTHPTPALLTCQVTAGDPVAGATVVAEVSGPDGVLGTATLFDDGLPVHGDDTANDGVYSSYYNAFPSSGNYAFTVRVVNTKGVSGIDNPEKNEIPRAITSIPAFSRETSANVTVSGVPALDRQWVRVNALSFHKNSGASNTGTLKTSLTFNTPNAVFNPTADDLTISLNGFGATTFIPMDIFKVKKPGSFSIQDKTRGISGSLQTFIGGSSRSELVLSSKQVPAGSFTPGISTTQRVKFGNFDETISLKTNVNSANSGVTYNAKKNYLNSTVLYVDGFKGAVKHLQNDKDSFRLVATLDGFLNYDPATQTLVIDLGGLKFTVGPDDLTVSGTKAKGSIALGNGKIDVVIDKGTGVLSVKGSKVNIGKNVGGSVVIGVTAGSFNQANILVLREKVKPGSSSLKF